MQLQAQEFSAGIGPKDCIVAAQGKIEQAAFEQRAEDRKEQRHKEMTGTQCTRPQESGGQQQPKRINNGDGTPGRVPVICRDWERGNCTHRNCKFQHPQDAFASKALRSQSFQSTASTSGPPASGTGSQR